MTINGIKYPRLWVRRINKVRKLFGTYIAGCVLAGSRVRPGTAMRILGIPTNLA